MKKILTKKIGMTQIIAEDGRAIASTVLDASPGIIVRRKSKDKDGYSAVVVGYGEVAAKRLSKPQAGQVRELGRGFKIFKETMINNDLTADKGDYLYPDFAVGEKIAASGISAGKGFQGTIKRWGFARGPMSHGSKSHRIPGSIGGHTYPGRVFKGKKMAGQMGGVRVTTKNIEVVAIDEEHHLIIVKGSVPGKNGAWIELSSKGEPKISKQAEIISKQAEVAVADSQDDTAEHMTETVIETGNDKEEKTNE